MIISQAAQFKWPIFQIDVKSAFLNGVLKEEVYLKQPPGYVKIGEEEGTKIEGGALRVETSTTRHTSRRTGRSNVPTNIHIIQRRVEAM